MSERDEITVRVNGVPRRLPRGTTVAALLELLGVPAAGTAVELAGTVVPRASFATARLEEGQEVEIARFVGGG